MKGTLLLRPKQFFVRISPRIAVGSLSNATYYSLRMRYKQRKLRSIRLVMKGTFLLRSKEFIVRVFPRNAVGSLSNTAWYCLRMRYKLCKLC
jgi:hypothetical protein